MNYLLEKADTYHVEEAQGAQHTATKPSCSKLSIDSHCIIPVFRAQSHVV